MAHICGKHRKHRSEIVSPGYPFLQYVYCEGMTQIVKSWSLTFSTMGNPHYFKINTEFPIDRIRADHCMIRCHEEIICIFVPPDFSLYLTESGGSGSGKTRFWLKPNLMQMHSSYVVTDPKGYNNIGQRKSHTVRRKSPAMWLFLYPI